MSSSVYKPLLYTLLDIIFQSCFFMLYVYSNNSKNKVILSHGSKNFSEYIVQYAACDITFYLKTQLFFNTIETKKCYQESVSL